MSTSMSSLSDEEDATQTDVSMTAPPPPLIVKPAAESVYRQMTAKRRKLLHERVAQAAPLPHELDPLLHIPQSTSVNAMALPSGSRHLFTGVSCSLSLPL
jgi:hypothetical protein